MTTKPRQRFTDKFKREAVALLQPRGRPLHLRQELTIAAIQRQRPALGFIHHSGRGSQYAAGDYRELLKANGIVPSMSRKGNCWDNAPMESWFHILKTELIHHTGGRKVIIAPDGSHAWCGRSRGPTTRWFARWRGRIGGSGWPTRSNKGMMSGWIDTPRCAPQPTENPSNSTCNVEEAPRPRSSFHHGQGRPKRDRNNTARRHVEAIGNHGRVSRHSSSNDNRPSLVEIMMYRYKAIIGWRLRARLPHQRTEAKIRCSVVNRN